MMKTRKVLTNSLVLAIFLLASGMIALAEGVNFTGVWDTNFGTMTLKQNGNSVTGAYTHDDGRIEGKVSGDRLDFRWFEEPTYSPPNDAGGGYFIIAADGKSFKGKWRYGFSGPWRDGEWKGELMTMPVEPTVVMSPSMSAKANSAPLSYNARNASYTESPGALSIVSARPTLRRPGRYALSSLRRLIISI